MNIRAYIYVVKAFSEDRGGRILCFRCAVEDITSGSTENFDLALEEGSTGDGNDMRSTPRCASCNKMLHDFCIA